MEEKQNNINISESSLHITRIYEKSHGSFFTFSEKGEVLGMPYQLHSYHGNSLVKSHIKQQTPFWIEKKSNKTIFSPFQIRLTLHDIKGDDNNNHLVHLIINRAEHKYCRIVGRLGRPQNPEAQCGSVFGAFESQQKFGYGTEFDGEFGWPRALVSLPESHQRDDSNEERSSDVSSREDFCDRSRSRRYVHCASGVRPDRLTSVEIRQWWMGKLREKKLEMNMIID